MAVSYQTASFFDVPGFLRSRDSAKNSPLQEGQQCSGSTVRHVESALLYMLSRLLLACPCSLKTFQITAAWSGSLLYPTLPFEFQVTPWIYLSAVSETECDVDVVSDKDPVGENVTVQMWPTPRLVQLPALDVGDGKPTTPGYEEIEFTVTPSSTPDIIIHGFGILPIALAELLDV